MIFLLFLRIFLYKYFLYYFLLFIYFLCRLSIISYFVVACNMIVRSAKRNVYSQNCCSFFSAVNSLHLIKMWLKSIYYLYICCFDFVWGRRILWLSSLFLYGLLFFRCVAASEFRNKRALHSRKFIELDICCAHIYIYTVEMIR